MNYVFHRKITYFIDNNNHLNRISLLSSQLFNIYHNLTVKSVKQNYTIDFSLVPLSYVKKFTKNQLIKTNSWLTFLPLFFIFLFSTNLNAQTTDVFTYSTTWTCPSGVSSIQVDAYGAGGGGGYGGGSNKNGGGGGGGGAYTNNNAITVVAGTTYTITVGTGGLAGTSGTPNAGNGTATTATFGVTTITANPGFGGKSYGNGGTGGAGGTAGTRAGGAGGTGTAAGSGGGGGCAGTTGAGVAGAVPTAGAAGTGGTIAGAGAAGSTTNTATGSTGNLYGGGGSGGTKSSSGGAGYDGYLSITYTIPAPANDNCTTAIALTVNSTCTYTTYTNSNATATTAPSTPPAPGCSSYLGGDVWFKVVVPATGVLNLDSTQGTMTDGGMAVYSGACGGLTLIACDDDSSVNGLMPALSLSGLTPASTVYIRFWEYGNDNNGTFGICASTPSPCVAPTAQPTALILTPSGGNMSGSFTAASPAPTNYLVVYNTTGTTPAPTNGASYTIGGTVGAGNIVVDNDTNTSFSATGLSSLTTYYFFVFSYNTGTCAGGPIYKTTTPLTGNATTGLAYCTPVSTTVSDYISAFSTTGGINNINHTSSGSAAGGYGDYYSTEYVSQVAGGTINFSETYVGGSSGFNIWVDWNNDGDFVDAGEKVFASAAIASSNTGSFVIPGLTAVGNYRMRIRAWYNNNNPDSCTSITYGEAQDYKLTVLTPSLCPGNPSNIVVSAITTTTATISWTAASPAPASGYQYYIATTNTAPPTFTGSTAAGVLTKNLTGLLSETTYYVWVRSNCGATQGYWIGYVTFQTPCAPGNGTGVSTLGCPSVVSGGLGLSGANPAPITCSSASSCVDLEATYLQLGQTTSYTAQSIPYTPPYQFKCLQNAVSVNTDDVWSPQIDLPFNFCFYGNNFNKCLIGSNGVLTFDLTNNTAGGYSEYSFASNLPSTSLFKNTIFGVYHDIDPSKGGTVGWELITLSSGCRALVASWSDIPMFSSSCNSILYTGMMVLYENTNIIEVYVKEKNVCSSWNGGNAVVGIQDGTGAQATVAPSRNSLDTDWTVTNEAWRFVPSGTSITSIKWYQGAGTAGPVVGTTDVINVCPAATTIYTAEVSYSLCNGTTLKQTGQTTVTVSGNKVWNGSVSTNWNVANNWTPVGVPTSADCVVIPNVVNKPIVSGASFNGVGKNLTVQNGAILTVQATNSLTITDFVTVVSGGQFIINNNASLVQTNNVANTGDIQYQRSINTRRQDYTYWTSPVANFPVASVSPGTSTGYIYKWLPTIVANTNGWGNWTNTTENMVTGKGYIVRGPNAYSLSSVASYTATLTGVPNNGIITTPISRGTYNGVNYSTGVSTTQSTKDDDNWNLIGNPYPSSIKAIDFLNNNTNIAGFIKLWTHGTLLNSATTDPFYADYVYNYTPADYITYNVSGTSSGPAVFNGFIGSGQGFLVLMNHTSAATTETVTFDNSLRSSGYSNSQYFKSANNKASNDTYERHRIWLDLIANGGNSVRTLVGYISDATNNEDRLFDAFTDEKLSLNLYSLINDKMMTIQGRALPFNRNDQVPLGMNVPQDGSYSIAIGTVDGIFTDANQNIYLEDKVLNVIHDLRTKPYTFTATKGITNNRFVLRYKNNSLSDYESNNVNDIKIYATNHINVSSSFSKIKEVIVYDVLGKTLIDLKNINQTEISINELKPTTNMLMVKVILENNQVVIKKVIY